MGPYERRQHERIEHLRERGTLTERARQKVNPFRLEPREGQTMEEAQVERYVDKCLSFGRALDRRSALESSEGVKESQENSV